MGFLKALLLGVSLAYGQQPAPQGLIGAPYRDFSGGYNDTVAPSNLQPNQSPNLLNVKIDDPPGSLKPREGYLSCGITPSGLPATVLYEYNFNSSGGVPRFIVSDSSVAWQTQDCVTFTTVTTRLQGGPLPSIATVRDKIWIVNRSTHVITWDGTTEAILDGRANTPSPAPARFNYIEFWNERVWGARTTTNPSGVYFSDLTDTLGNDLDPSTGTLSWPADNVIQVAQENGSPIYGIKVYRNALFVFKENGIWRIDFNGPFDITVSKTLSSVGTRYQASIVEHDNILYFVGTDGFYAFDGDRAVRVSDGFKNKFDAINQTSVNQSQKTWDVKADFDDGSYSSATSVSNDGYIAVSTRSVLMSNGDFASGLSPWACTGSGSPLCQVSGGAASLVSNGADATAVVLYLYNSSGTVLETYDYNLVYSAGLVTLDISEHIGETVNLVFYVSQGAAGWAKLTSPNFTANSQVTFQGTITWQVGFASLDDFYISTLFSSATWTSDIFDLVEVSSFSTFDVASSLNGNTIDYSIRLGTSATAITQNQYASILPGALIQGGTTSTIFVQVKATFTVVSSTHTTPLLDYVTVNTIRGNGAAQSIYSFSMLGNLYVSVATGSSNSNNTVFVRSRLPLDSWTIYDWKVGPMAEFNDRFYAGSSVDSKVYRMNYGNNDNGSAIGWYWESREETYGLPNIRKYLMEINLDYRKGTETALTAGYSRDGGTAYTSRSVSASGTGRGTSRLFMAGSNSTDYRFKVSGSTLDGTVTVLGLTGWARPAVIRE